MTLYRKTDKLGTMRYLFSLGRLAIKRRRNRIGFFDSTFKKKLPSVTEFIELVDSVKKNRITQTYFLDTSETKIYSSWSNSGWFRTKGFLMGRLKGKYVWNYGKHSYFLHPSKSDETSRADFYGQVSNLVDTVSLERITNVRVSLGKYHASTLNIYRCYFEQLEEKSKFTFNRALILDINGSELFQHFILDTLPILSFVRTFLIQNPDVIVVLPKPASIFTNRHFFIERLGISNPIYDFPLNSVETISVKSCFVVQFKPKNYRQTPSKLYKLMHDDLYRAPEPPLPQKKYLLYISRGPVEMRKVENESSIFSVLEQHSKEKGLTFRNVNPSVASIDEIAQITSRAQIVVYLHGGQGLNAIFAPTGTQIIEFINVNETRTFGHLFTSIGFEHVVIPINSHHVDKKPIKLPENTLIQALNTPLSELSSI